MTDGSDTTGDGGDDPPAAPSLPRKGSVRRKLRAYFFAGILVTAPIGITFYLAWLFINWVDGKITPLLPPAYNPDSCSLKGCTAIIPACK